MNECLVLAVLQCHTPLGAIVVLLENQREGGRSVGHDGFVFFSLVTTSSGATRPHKPRDVLSVFTSGKNTSINIRQSLEIS